MYSLDFASCKECQGTKLWPNGNPFSGVEQSRGISHLQVDYTLTW